MARCKICGKEITRGKNKTHHPVCIKNLYGSRNIPSVEVFPDEVPTLFKKMEGKFSISFVQSMVPLVLRPRKRLLVRAKDEGDFRLKLQAKSFPMLPQVQNICMTAADTMGIPVPFHTLVQLPDQSEAYLERRIHGAKNHPVTVKSLQEILSRETSYSGDLLDIGRKIRELSEFPGLDVQLFFETLLFSFIIGHSDVNLRSFSMMFYPEEPPRLAPVLNILSDRLYLPDVDDFAMPMQGKMTGLKGTDFAAFSKLLNIHDKAYTRIFLRYFKGKRLIGRLIKDSSLPMEVKIKFSDIVTERFKRLFS